uniref:BED-type domain-containing protein n=1 Tax=Meloidogyne floridensis TaxID=298350 RepID=A0A915PBD6_9BILA
MARQWSNGVMALSLHNSNGVSFLIILNISVLLEGGGKDKGKRKVGSTSGGGQGHEEHGYVGRGHDAAGYEEQGYGGQGYDAQAYGGEGYGGQGYDAQAYGGEGYGGLGHQEYAEYTVTSNRPPYHPIQAIDPLNSYILQSRRTSSTWNHFTQIGNDKVACKECGLKMSARLGNLKTHLTTCWKPTDNFTSVGNGYVECNKCKKVMTSKYLKNLLDHIETSCKEKTSSTWNHFTEPENGKVKCKKCDTEMSSKRLQNLTRHHNRCKKEGEAPNVEEGDNEATESDRD